MPPSRVTRTQRHVTRGMIQLPRLVATALLAFQALLWGGGNIIEARAVAESLARSAHVEDTSNPTCPPIHSDLDCLVCRAFSGGATGGHAPSLGPVSFASAITDLDGIEGIPGSPRGPLGSRAPPSA